MKWNNLKNGKCPQCNSWLRDGKRFETSECVSCDFFIRNQKLKEIITPKPKTVSQFSDEERMSALSHEGVEPLHHDWNN